MNICLVVRISLLEQEIKNICFKIIRNAKNVVTRLLSLSVYYVWRALNRATLNYSRNQQWTAKLLAFIFLSKCDWVFSFVIFLSIMLWLNVINAQFHPIIRFLSTGQQPVEEMWMREMKAQLCVWSLNVWKMIHLRTCEYWKTLQHTQSYPCFYSVSISV